ncbi:MAG: DNA polymerase III subunit beta [Actinomycetota bacterium]
MKFVCEKDLLAKALGATARAATGRATNPVLSCLRLVLAKNRLRITGTDGDLTIESTIEVADGEDGVVLVPAKLVSEVVGSMKSGRVQFVVEGDKISVDAKDVEFSLPTGAEGDFPKWSGSDGGGASVDTVVLTEALKQVVRAASTDDARGVITGVLFSGDAGKLRLVATDSYRLAIREIEAAILPDGAQAIVPARALAEVIRLQSFGETMNVAVTDNDATFQVGSTRLVTRLLKGTYHDYKRLVPKSQPNSVTLNRDEALEAIRRVKLIARDPVGSPLRLRIFKDDITMRVVSQDNGEAVEKIDGEISGEEIEMAFNNEFLASGIDACDTEYVVIETSEPGKLAVIRPKDPKDGGSYLYLLMPQRL